MPCRKYSIEFQREMVEKYKEENRNGHVSKDRFARENGIPRSSFGDWYEDYENRKRNDAGLVKVKGQGQQGCVVVEYYGARLSCSDRPSLMMLLSCIREQAQP